MQIEWFSWLAIVIGVIIFACCIIASGLKIALEYERLVIFRLGRYARTIGPGVVFIWPFLETSKKVDLRIITQDIPRQEVMTKDNIPVLANTVVYFKVENPEDAIITFGTMELDEVLGERDKIAKDIRLIVDKETSDWGIDIKGIKIQEMELPSEMKRAFAKQAEAERDKRAAIIKAEGEFQAAKKLTEAAALMATEPIALQLRTLQTIRDISKDPSEKVVIFMPSGIGNVEDLIKTIKP